MGEGGGAAKVMLRTWQAAWPQPSRLIERTILMFEEAASGAWHREILHVHTCKNARNPPSTFQTTHSIKSY